MKEIPLGKSNLVALVDDEDFEILSSLNWRAHPSCRTVYARNTVRLPGGGQKNTYMHRLVLRGVGDEVTIDHRDGNGLNNQKANLRVATPSQNAANRAIPINHGRSEYKGVAWHKNNRKWRVRVQVKGLRLQVGMFSSEVEAAKAYDAAARRHFGEFAKTNFKGEEDEQLAA